MKVEWLDDTLLRVRITRGWFWKRAATVSRRREPYHSYITGNYTGEWRFDATDDRLSEWDCRRLDRQRDRAVARRQRQKNWVRVAKLPAMKVVR